MTPYTFYIPGINKMTGLSQQDWDFLCERAEENNVLPSSLAARIIANELAQWRDEIHYAAQQEGLIANQAMNQEKVIEEIV